MKMDNTDSTYSNNTDTQNNLSKLSAKKLEPPDVIPKQDQHEEEKKKNNKQEVER